MASWFQFAYLISCVGMALALLDSCLGFASLVWASCLVPSDCHCPHLNLSICQLCVTEMCSFKKTSFWCVLDNEETLLEYLVEIFPLTCNHWILVHLKVWPVPLPGVSCVPLLPCLVQESRCSSCKFPTLVQLLSHCGKNSFFLNLMSHLPGNKIPSHLTEFWPLKCEWKSYVLFPGLEKSCMCIQLFTLISPHTGLKQTFEGTCGRRQSYRQKEPGFLNHCLKESQLPKRKIHLGLYMSKDFFLVCPIIHFGVYMFHQLADSN